ncbi:ABC transporter ATP-binding protein [Kribbella sp. NPDC051587]|uniref:ABC transporter ATP-binding protein n=1 Tax=Kribbella sp. NPDC051587 TaxID=3364119 RepID=UPI0037AE90AF
MSDRRNYFDEQLLTITNLVVEYGGGVSALRGVSLAVPENGIVAVLGSAGAGKTTLLRTIAGIHGLRDATIERGRIVLDGTEITGLRPDRVVGAGIVQVPEVRRVFNRMTVEENLRTGAMRQRDRAVRESRRKRVFELFPILGERREERAGLLSGGEQQMLAIGRALMASPRLVLLDEPSLGQTPQMTARVAEAVREIHRHGTAVLLIEQDAEMALGLAQFVYVLAKGRISLSGPAADLVGSDEIRRLARGKTAQDSLNLRMGSS